MRVMTTQEVAQVQANLENTRFSHSSKWGYNAEVAVTQDREEMKLPIGSILEIYPEDEDDDSVILGVDSTFLVDTNNMTVLAVNTPSGGWINEG